MSRLRSRLDPMTALAIVKGWDTALREADWTTARSRLIEVA
jgi:hypothetical protein